jgi:hypothetical protein
MTKLNIPNPQAHDMGEMFGIPIERRTAIGIGMDAMVKMASEGAPRMVHASDIILYIQDLCETQEEFVWAISNHIAWMFRNGRMATTAAQQQEMINKYGQPAHLR